MALRRTLSLRSLFSTTRCCYQPSLSSIIRVGEKLNYNHSSSRLIPFGVSIFRCLSTSNVNHLTDAGIDSVVRLDLVQQMIDNVHSFTGFNWWASIVVTTLLVRGVMVPLMIYNERAWSWVTLLAPHATAYVEIEKQGGDPAALDRHLDEINNLLVENDGYNKKHIFSPFLYLPQHLVLTYMGVSITNMTGKVASFKTGGALWLADLTTPYSSFIFPLLTGLALWIAIECDAMVGFEGTLVTLKKRARILVIPMVLFGMLLPKALNCYMMSCMIFSIVFIFGEHRNCWK